MTELVPVAEVASRGGLEITLTGMTVVFTALILISLFIKALPHVTAFLDKRFPPEEDRMVVEDPAVTLAGGEREVVAAVAAFIAHRTMRGPGGRGPGGQG